MTEFSHDEAVAILNLIGTQADPENDAVMSVLDKIYKAWPNLILNEPSLLKSVQAWEARTSRMLKAATSRVSELIDEANARIEEAQSIANKAKIGFQFNLGDTYVEYDPEYGWNSSSC